MSTQDNATSFLASSTPKCQIFCCFYNCRDQCFLFLTLYRLGAQRVELVSLKGDGEQIIDKATHK